MSLDIAWVGLQCTILSAMSHLEGYIISVLIYTQKSERKSGTCRNWACRNETDDKKGNQRVNFT